MSDAEMDADTQRTPSTRRRPRNVSSLSAQQIQHKRDLDRKAQRALRQRVKSRLQDLEDDLARAKASSSDRERGMMEEIHALREENRKLRSCLESIGQFALDGASISETRRVSESQSPDSVPVGENDQIAGTDAAGPSDWPEHPVDQTERPVSHPRAEANAVAASDGDPYAMRTSNVHAEEHPASHHSQMDHQAWDDHVMPHNHDTNGQHQDIPDPYAHPSSTRSELPSPESEATPGRHLGGPCIMPPGHRDQYLDGPPPSDFQGPVMGPSNIMTPTSSVANPPSSTGIASVLPKHRTAVCPLDQILLDFMSSRRAMTAKGFAIESIAGPNQPSLQAIFHPERSTTVHATSRVLAEVLTTFSQVALPEKLAFMFVMFRTMRWQISPTDANYEEMPRWLRPTAIQITIPHPAWIDNIPWPRVRDMLIENPDKYPFAVFSELYSRNVTVNWPYDTMDSVLHREGDIILNPIFEKHVQRLSNWTVSSHFRDYLPEMTAAIYGSD